MTNNTFALSLLNARLLSGDIMPSLPHECSHEYCKPQNGMVLGVFDVPNNIYICRYQKKHVCSENECEYYQMGTCPVSGADYGVPYSSYDKNDYRTWGRDFRRRELVGLNNKPQLKKRKIKKTHKSCVYDIKEIIEKLLYSNIRETINKQKVELDEKKFKRKKLEYLKECRQKRTPPCVVYMMMLKNHCESTTVKLEILKYDADRIDRYAQMVLHVWDVAETYLEQSMQAKAVTLGTLYCMQQGFKMDNVVLIPSDVFLLYNLPAINDLPSFNFEKRKVTNSQQKIEQAYKEAGRLRVPLKDISLAQ